MDKPEDSAADAFTIATDMDLEGFTAMGDVVCVEVKEYGEDGLIVDDIEDYIGDSRWGWFLACGDANLAFPDGAAPSVIVWEDHGEISSSTDQMADGQRLIWYVKYCDKVDEEIWCAEYSPTGYSSKLPTQFPVPSSDLKDGLTPAEGVPDDVGSIHGTNSLVGYRLVEGNRISPLWGRWFNALTGTYVY
ncbi:MAG: hypothetical protein LBR27_03555 [Bifidobacteriaceae bacterium]|nr:hypothetical protein [Bifidobacteriaceae bacterium]